MILTTMNEPQTVNLEPILPTWFKYRQGKAELVGENTYRLTAPNQQEAFIRLHQGADGLWAGAFRLTADGPDFAISEAKYELPADAWHVAFELYRRHVLV